MADDPHQWFIQIRSGQEGPYSLAQLKEHPHLTPDTLVWREGWPSWRLIRDVEELQLIFEDDKQVPKPQEAPEEFQALTPLSPGNDVLVAEDPGLPPYMVAFILLVIVLYLCRMMIS